MVKSALRMNTEAQKERQASQRRAEAGQRGVLASAQRGAAEYLEGHGHAVVYGIVGFVAAALILIVGFWPTVLLALFAAIGVAIGRYRDGDQKTQVAFRSLIGRMR